MFLMNCPQILTERRNTTTKIVILDYLKSLNDKDVNFSQSRISVSNLIVIIKYKKVNVSKRKRKTRNAKGKSKLNQPLFM